MKKIYSLMALLVMATLCFAATAATAKVYIDNKYGVILYTNGDNWDRVENKLVDGEYVDISFTPGLSWNLDSSFNLTFYQIIRNGEVIAQNITPVFDIGFDFMVNDGDTIEILVNNPSVEKATITVDYGEYGEAAVKYMEVDGEDVVVKDGKFEANVDAQLLIFTDNMVYNILSVKLGDKELDYIMASGCYVGWIEGDATLTIVAEPKPSKDITLSLTSAEAVNVFRAMNYYFLGIESVEGLVDGDNALTVSPSMPVLDVQVKDEYTVVSATYTDAAGNTEQMPYDSWGKYYYVNVIDKDVVSINIETTEKVIEYMTFGVEIENLDVLKAYFIRTNNPRKLIADSDDPALLLHNGLNEFRITTEQGASIRVNLEFAADPITDITLDGNPVPSLKYDDFDNSIWGDITVSDGQVLKIGKTSAISSIANDSAASKVYNMQGIEVKGSCLPAGIYIINGKKTYVR